MENIATSEPMQDFDTFKMYVARLNRMIKRNMPFLFAAFRIQELSIQIVLSNRPFPSYLKEALFDSVISKTTVVVQYTLQPSESLDESSPKEMVRIRKFANVKAFMDATRQLDDILLKIKTVMD